MTINVVMSNKLKVVIRNTEYQILVLQIRDDNYNQIFICSKLLKEAD